MPTTDVREDSFEVSADLRSERYTIALSRNAYELLLQWLSGAGLEESYENGRHTNAGRAKEAIKTIVTSKLSLNGEAAARVTGHVTETQSSTLLHLSVL